MRRLLVFAVLLFALPAHAVDIDWVLVGNAGNAADTDTNCLAANCGSVSYDYLISKYEITNAQYAEFLNAKAASDPLNLYEMQMGSDAVFGGIERSGVSGSYTYTVKAGFANKPVTHVTFYDALRFVNWLVNGQGSGDTETGAYTLLGGTPNPSNGPTVLRNPGATIFLPSENEWYKAAYYDPATASFFDSAAGSDAAITCSPPTAAPNSANCRNAVGRFTDVGSYSGSPSPYGTFDQCGNAMEWNEQIIENGTGADEDICRGQRGGQVAGNEQHLEARRPSEPRAPQLSSPMDGFRVAARPSNESRWRVEVVVLGHYTNDVEAGGEEWTFSVGAEDVPDLDGREKLTLLDTNDGDSSPDFLSFRDTSDRVVFEHTYAGQLPAWIYLTQWGWSNDRGGRTTFDCCSWWRNDDDDYLTGAAYLLLQGLESGRAYQFDYPSLQGGFGRRHGLRARLTVSRLVQPVGWSLSRPSRIHPRATQPSRKAEPEE
jgi:formylglycine-generating enzyme required for sulfatase activity